LAKTRIKKPLIVTCHGYDLNVLYDYKYGIRRYPQYDKLVSLVMHEGDLIIVPSKLLYKRALEAGAHASKVVIVPNAVDTTIFNPNIDGFEFRRKYGLNKEALILTIRNLKPWYRVDKVLNVAEIVLRKINAHFFIIGDGELRKALIKTAKKLKIHHRVRFVGKMPRSEIPKALAAADVIFDPCPIGQGINVLEAMACAKPVVGIDTKGMWDYILDKETGFLVDFADDESIAEKIVYLIQNKKEAIRMGINGRKLVEREYSMDRRVDRILELYRKLLCQ
jgi:glycosyltransferase involved in cell wall biosynthesis